MTVGGSGVFTLTYKGQRIAYLFFDGKFTVQPHSPPAYLAPMVAGVPTKIVPDDPGTLGLRVYELWDASAWWALLSHGKSIMTALQQAASNGDLELKKVNKTPTGKMLSTVYDLRGTHLLERGSTQHVIGGIVVPGIIEITPMPSSSTVITDPPTFVPAPLSPTKPEPKQYTEPELAAGVYALRSFKLGTGKIRSLHREFEWTNGVAIAECRMAREDESHQIPDQNCMCGLYGLDNLSRLVKEYSSGANRCVAVIAAEGKTIIGDRGLKTQAARVVAYWVQTLTELEVMQREVPDAKHFEDMDEMLAKYHFPPWREAEVPDLPSRWLYRPERRPEEMSLPEFMPARKPQVRGLAPDAATMQRMWNDIAPLIKAATQGGIAAVQQLTGFTPPPRTTTPQAQPYVPPDQRKPPTA